MKKKWFTLLHEDEFITLITELLRDDTQKCSGTDDIENDITLDGKEYLLDDKAAKVLYE